MWYNSQNVYFIIISMEDVSLNVREKVFRLSPLTPLDAATIIQKEIGEILPKKEEYVNPFLLSRIGLLNNSRIKITPKKIQIICQLVQAHLGEGNFFKKVENLLLLDEIKAEESNVQNTSGIAKALELLNIKNKNAFDLLMYLSFFPDGLFVGDVDQIERLYFLQFGGWKKLIFHIAKHKNL